MSWCALRKAGGLWGQKKGETSTTNTHIAPACTAEICFLHHFVFVFDFHLAARSAASLSWALALLRIQEPAVCLLTAES